MKKAEFLDRLCQELRFQTDPDEIRKVVAFYDQAIEDRMEDGAGEEEAVAAMGDIDGIVREIRSAWRQDQERSGGGDEPGRVSLEYDPDVTGRIDVYDTSGDVSVLPSPDGMIHISYRASEEWRYDVAGSESVTIRRVRNAGREEKMNFDIFGYKFSFTKPDIKWLFSGDTELEIRLPAGRAVSLGVVTASGDVAVRDVSVSSLSLRLAGGDAGICSVAAEGRISVSTASGDAEFSDVTGDGISVTTASGDVSMARVRCGGLTVRTASGDVDAEGIEARESLAITAVSGDIDAGLGLPCPAVNVESVSGDVSLELAGSERLYTVTARTSSGDVDVDGDALDGSNRVRIKTISGDIDVGFAG